MRAHFSFAATAFDGIDFSGNAIVVGDAAIIKKLGLPIPLPDRLVNLLVRFLDPNQGRLSQRARSQEFAALTDEKVVQVEAQYARILG